MNIPNNKLTGKVSFDEVVSSWLKDEWYYSFYDSMRSRETEDLVLRADLNDESENQKRYDLLYANRHPILDHVPKETTWYATEITQGDIPNLLLIQTTWCKHVSNGTCRLSDAINDFDNNLKKIGSENADKITGVYATLAQKTHQETAIIFTAADTASPWTAVEGNHRLIALGASLMKGDIASYKAYVGIFPNE